MSLKAPLPHPWHRGTGRALCRGPPAPGEHPKRDPGCPYPGAVWGLHALMDGKTQLARPQGELRVDTSTGVRWRPILTGAQYLKKTSPENPTIIPDFFSGPSRVRPKISFFRVGSFSDPEKPDWILLAHPNFSSGPQLNAQK